MLKLAILLDEKLGYCRCVQRTSSPAKIDSDKLFQIELHEQIFWKDRFFLPYSPAAQLAILEDAQKQPRKLTSRGYYDSGKKHVCLHNADNRLI